MINIDISLLKEHPLNKEIYGDDNPEQFAELVEKIRVSGWIKPLLVKRFDYTIISGHRRFLAAKALQKTEILVEFTNVDEDEELELLLNENAFREKTTVQKVREAEFYRKIEEKKAEERQLFGADLSANLHGGRTNAIVGEKIGMSARSYHDARKVVAKIDQEDDTEVKEFLEATLNSSVNAASKLVDRPDEFLHAVIIKSSGDTKNVASIVRELEGSENLPEVHLPYGSQFQVIYLDLSVSFDNDPAKLPISNIAEADSVLFIWALPKGLEEAFSLIKKWGFKYRTCMLWNSDCFREVSAYGQILLISTKGKISTMVENEANNSDVEKPTMIRTMIEKTYSGDKLQILPDGWQILGMEN